MACATATPGATADPLGVWPLAHAPAVLAGFDPPEQPWDAGHRGVDLAGSAGQSVRAALAGTVRYAGRLAGRGVVVVDHGETRTTYEPVASLVHVGAPVSTGQLIGRLEAAGGHCLPRACLHWGLRRGDAYLDPLGLVGNGPARLLPLWRSTPATDRGEELRSVRRSRAPASEATWTVLALGLKVLLHQGRLG